MSYVDSAIASWKWTQVPAGVGPEAEAIQKGFRDLNVRDELTLAMREKAALLRKELEELYQLCASGRDQEAAQRVLLSLDGALRAGRFLDVDALLRSLDASRVGPSLLLTVLTITSYAKRLLGFRNTFLAHAEQQLRAALGEERTNALLASRR